MPAFKNNYLIIALVVLLLFSFGFNNQPEEYTIKGVLLEKISTLIEWPDLVDNSHKDKFIVGIYGKHEFGNSLEEIYSERKIQNKNVVVKYIEKYSEINDCRVLFIPKLSNEQLKEVLEFVRKKPVLTISEIDGYAEKGVHVNFYTEGENIRFEINENSVKESGISMNHLLLSLAKIVRTRK